MPAYVRKLSREDASLGRMLIEKSKWGMFPQPGGAISADVGGVRSRLRVEGERCSCVPPEHEHRYLRMGAARRRIVFVAGARVTVDRANGAYRVRNGR
jgi:hypothetical protein